MRSPCCARLSEGCRHLCCGRRAVLCRGQCNRCYEDISITILVMMHSCWRWSWGSLANATCQCAWITYSITRQQEKRANWFLGEKYGTQIGGTGRIGYDGAQNLTSTRKMDGFDHGRWPWAGTIQQGAYCMLTIHYCMMFHAYDKDHQHLFRFDLIVAEVTYKKDNAAILKKTINNMLYKAMKQI